MTHESVFALPSLQCCKLVPAPPTPLLVDSHLCLPTRAWGTLVLLDHLSSPSSNAKAGSSPKLSLTLSGTGHSLRAPQYSVHAVCWGFLPRSCNYPFGGLVPS